MAISDRTRKILWARSGNQCAICRETLVKDGTAQSAESVIGEEAHIVARSPGGPRYEALPDNKRDEPENLLLLCRVDHKQVDDQVEEFTVGKLRQIKTEHERRVFTTMGAVDGASVLTHKPDSPRVTIVDFPDPRDLNVHDVIPAKYADLSATPTPYVLRKHDEYLRDDLMAAAETPGQPRLIIVTGNSAVGKTRACYEAIKANDSLRSWALRKPRTMKGLENLLSEVTDKTVVWLNELQSYLPKMGEHDSVTEPFTNLLLDASKKVIFIGSMWTSHWEESTRTSSYSPVKELLENSRTTRRVEVPWKFGKAEIGALNKAMQEDERLRAAVQLAGGPVGTEVIQTLAGGPQLTARYEDLQRDDSPLARMRLACLTAAIDIRRMGWNEPIPKNLLRRAAKTYLTSEDLQDKALFSLALHEPDKQGLATGAGLVNQQIGVPALRRLVTSAPDSKDRYVIHDYLFEYGLRKRRLSRVESEVWRAAAFRDDTPAPIAAELARSAFIRAIWYSRHLMDSGGYQTLQRLEEIGGLDDKYSVEYFDHIDHAEDTRVIEMLAARGDIDRLTQWADAGHYSACEQLASVLVLRGDLADLANHRSYNDMSYGPRYARTLALRGDISELRAEADRMDDRAAEWLGRIDKAEDEAMALSYRVDISDEGPRYALLLSWLGDVHTLTGRADAGDEDATFHLSEVLTARGETQVLKKRFGGGDAWAGYWLARVAAARQDTLSLEDLARVGVFEAAKLLALTLNVEMLEDDGGTHNFHNGV